MQSKDELEREAWIRKQQEAKRRELSKIRSEQGKKGAAKSSETYARRRRLKELEPILNKWIEDVANGKLALEDIEEKYRPYVEHMAALMKVELEKMRIMLERAEAKRRFREKLGMSEDEE